jgi:hypothetical protein
MITTFRLQIIRKHLILKLNFVGSARLVLKFGESRPCEAVAVGEDSENGRNRGKTIVDQKRRGDPFRLLLFVAVKVVSGALLDLAAAAGVVVVIPLVGKGLTRMDLAHHVQNHCGIEGKVRKEKANHFLFLQPITLSKSLTARRPSVVCQPLPATDAKIGSLRFSLSLSLSFADGAKKKEEEQASEGARARSSPPH